MFLFNNNTKKPFAEWLICYTAIHPRDVISGS